MHKGKKIVLHPMSPTAILKDDLERVQREKRNGNTVIQVKANEIAQPKNKESNSKKGEIKLKGAVMLATKSELRDLEQSNDECYALICKETLFSLDNIPASLPPTIANLLQEYEDVFPAENPPGLPPMRRIEHQIDLIPGASLPNPEETHEIQRQVQELIDKGYVRESLSPCSDRKSVV